jgi:predicted dehydrogenase
MRVGVVGVGSMGQHHARIYSELQGVELAGVVDVDKARAREIAERCSVDWYADYRDIIRRVDAVSIALPTHLHGKAAIDFIKEGKAVLVEKPIASTVEEAERMIEVARRNDVVLQVGHVERFNPSVEAMKKVLREEKPVLIEGKRMGPYTPRMSGVGVVIDLMIHDIDVARYLLEEDLILESFTKGRLFSQNEDFALGIFQANDTKVILSASRITQRKIRKLNVTTPSKYITLDYISQDIDIYYHSLPSYLARKNGLRMRQEYIIEKPYIEKVEPLKKELAHFVDCVRRHEEPLVTGEDGLYCLKMALDLIGGGVLEGMRYRPGKAWATAGNGIR